MKLIKWWKNTPRKFTKRELIQQKLIWCIGWIEINLFTKSKNRAFREACYLGNISYRKMKGVRGRAR